MAPTLPPSRDARQAPSRRWLIRPAAGLILALAVLQAPAALAESVTQGLYTVIHAPGRDKTARFILRQAARAMGNLEEDLGGPFLQRVTIVVLDRERGNGPPLPGGMPAWFAGAAVPEEWTLWLKTSAALEQGPADLPRTLAHELAHLYLRWRTGGRRLPLWLEEGLAMRESGEYDLGFRFDLMGAAALGDLMELSAIERAFPSEEGRARVAYAAGVSFLAYLDRLGGAGSVRRLLDGVAAGPTFDDAFSRVYGLRLETAEAQWRRSLTRWSRWLAAAAGGTSLWGLISLLFLLTYLVKSHRARRLLEAMDAEEEPVYEPPSDDDLPPRRLGPGMGSWPGRRDRQH